GDRERKRDDAHDDPGDDVAEELPSRIAAPKDGEELRLESRVRHEGAGAEPARRDVALRVVDRAFHVRGGTRRPGSRRPLPRSATTARALHWRLPDVLFEERVH